MTQKPKRNRLRTPESHRLHTKVGAIVLAGAVAFTGLISADTMGLVQHTEASWEDSEHSRSSVHGGSVESPNNVACTDGNTISWEAPESSVPVHGYVLQIRRSGPFGWGDPREERIGDPAQTSRVFTRSFLERIFTDLLGANYEVSVQTMGPGEWVSDVSETSGSFRVPVSGSTRCRP